MLTSRGPYAAITWQAEMDEEEEHEEEKRQYEALMSDLKSTLATQGKAIEERDVRIAALIAEAQKRSESREQLALRAELEALRQQLETKEAEVQSGKREEAESVARIEEINSAVRAAESTAAAKAVEEGRRTDKIEADLRVELKESTDKLDAAKKRYTSLSEKFAQREDIIVELRARMDECVIPREPMP